MILLRPTIAIILGFVILFGISITAYYHINKASEVLQAQLRETEKLVHTEQWEQAIQRVEDLQIKWSAYKNWWAIFLNHASLSNIEISLSRLQQFILTENRALALAELHTLLVLLKDIPQSEMVKIYNIL